MKSSGSTRSSSPSVSVIMNCLNCSRYVREALDSVFAQTYDDWEIVFWDNASTDGSGEIAQSYGTRVRYFRGPETVPLGHARNLAIGEAQGKYLAFLDCDDLWMPTKLEKQVKLFEKDQEVALVFCDSIFFRSGRETRSLYSKRKPPRGNIFRYLVSNYCLSMESVVIRRSALDSMEGWFDNRLAVAEEADLFLRLCYRYKADYVDEPLSKWRINPESGTHLLFHVVSEENELILRKLEKIVPSFREDFAEEILILEQKIAFRKAVAARREGDTVRARSLVRPYLADKKCFALFCSTFFPQIVFRLLWEGYLRFRYLFS